MPTNCIHTVSSPTLVMEDAKQATQHTTKTTPTLDGLPAELRLWIFDLFFRSTVLHVRHSEVVAGDGRRARTGNIRLMSAPPQPYEKLNLVCRKFNDEIGTSWHSKVTYHFPSTLSFLDVLSQWPARKISEFKNAVLVGTPILLPREWEEGGAYNTSYFVPDILDMAIGLALDTLTVENIWIEPTAETRDPETRLFIYKDIYKLLMSRGWKELRYVSSILGFHPRAIRRLEKRVQRLRHERDERDFELTFNMQHIRPIAIRHGEHAGCPCTFKTASLIQDTDKDVMEVEQWWADHPAKRDEQLARDWRRPKMAVAVSARRGANADYMQDSNSLLDDIRRMLGSANWTELRQTPGCFLDDGVDFPGNDIDTLDYYWSDISSESSD